MFDAFLRFCHRFERRVSAPVLATLAAVLFLSGVVGYGLGSSGSSSEVAKPASSTTTLKPSETSTTLAGRSPIPGFRTAEFTITPVGGQAARYCGMLADSNEQRAQGLMNQPDLHGFDGMLFVFPTDSTASFYMANVKFPLSVSWFDGIGNFVSSATMEVCAVAAEACPKYGATSAYRFALETAKGGPDLHIGAGSVLAIGAGGSCA